MKRAIVYSHAFAVIFDELAQCERSLIEDTLVALAMDPGAQDHAVLATDPEAGRFNLLIGIHLGAFRDTGESFEVEEIETISGRPAEIAYGT